ncbi:MAG TPA: cell division protein FtsL [Terracidiphilus sp.]|jgi:cell division protein FtsL|nr:cell division protein FtsL [Terracidiphilus sp.]
MAACTTTYFEAGRSWKARVAERNAELLAQQAVLRRRVRTPEFYFTKHFDNSRLVKASDPVRVRQMRSFAAAATVLFSLIMIYGLQHFYAIESSYRVESEKQTVEQLREENRQLRLTEAELTQPARIDNMARHLGLAAPQPGQVVHPNAAPVANGAPVLAQITPPAPAVR